MNKCTRHWRVALSKMRQKLHQAIKRKQAGKAHAMQKNLL